MSVLFIDGGIQTWDFPVKRSKTRPVLSVPIRYIRRIHRCFLSVTFGNTHWPLAQACRACSLSIAKSISRVKKKSVTAHHQTFWTSECFSTKSAPYFFGRLFGLVSSAIHRLITAAIRLGFCLICFCSFTNSLIRSSSAIQSSHLIQLINRIVSSLIPLNVNHQMIELNLSNSVA